MSLAGDDACGDDGGGGCLYIVSTPIGNLGDITLRAIETLRSAPLIVAEDSRRTRALLSHLGIGKKVVRAINAHASPRELAEIVAELESGKDVAYATDAGTPTVSDPGRALVELAARRGIPTRIVPGASAVTAAVALSGMVDAAFTFLGFLPRKGGARRASLERVVTSPVPVVLFESPERMAETLEELSALAPERAAFVGRELTKLHEQGLRGTLSELAALPSSWRGEITLVVAAAPPSDPMSSGAPLIEACLRAALGAGVSPSHIAQALAKAAGLPRSPLYARALELAGRVPDTARPAGEALAEEPPTVGERARGAAEDPDESHER